MYYVGVDVGIWLNECAGVRVRHPPFCARFNACCHGTRVVTACVTMCSVAITPAKHRILTEVMFSSLSCVCMCMGVCMGVCVCVCVCVCVQCVIVARHRVDVAGGFSRGIGHNLRQASPRSFYVDNCDMDALVR